MTRTELEAKIWAITGRQLTGESVDALLDLAEAYTAERLEHHSRNALHHTGGMDLWPVIGVLADAMLGAPDADLEVIHGDPGRQDGRAAA